MNKLLIICLAGLIIISCNEDTEPKINSVAEDLEKVIKDNNIKALGICYTGSTCDGGGGVTDYAFVGDNFVRVLNTTYNLNSVVYYTIQPIGVTPDTKNHLILYFPKP